MTRFLLYSLILSIFISISACTEEKKEVVIQSDEMTPEQQKAWANAFKSEALNDAKNKKFKPLPSF